MSNPLRHAGYLLLLLAAALSSRTGNALGQCAPPARNVLLIAADAGGRKDTIFFGHDPAATRGVDTMLCERELPPMPPSGGYDLRFANPPGYENVQPPAGLGQGSLRDYRTQASRFQTDTLRVRFQPGAGGFPFTFTWSPASLAAICDSALLMDEFGGGLFSARMDAAPSLVVSNPAVTSLLLVVFGALEAPASPSLISPANDATNQSTSPTLLWNGAIGASRYAVQVSAESLFVTPVVNDSGVTLTTLPVSGLQPAATYFWRVRAGNGAGNSPWSATWKFVTTSVVTNGYGVQNGWNMISLPLTVQDNRTTAVYPTASTLAFFFGSSGYASAESLSYGTGYWLKFPAPQSVGITGTVRLLDTLDLRAGWNLVGTISTPVDTGAIQEIPAGLVLTSYFDFTGSYVAAGTLLPGRSYWVKAAMPGRLVFSSGVALRGRTTK